MAASKVSTVPATVIVTSISHAPPGVSGGGEGGGGEGGGGLGGGGEGGGGDGCGGVGGGDEGGNDGGLQVTFRLLQCVIASRMHPESLSPGG